MGVVVWASTGNQDWSVATNWNTGAKPVNDDQVLFTGSSQITCNQGMSDPTALSLDIRIDPAYVGNIGSPGNPLLCTVIPLTHRGQGTVYYEGSDVAKANTVYCDATRMVASGPAMVITGTSSIWTIGVKRGYCDINTSVDLSQLYVTYRNNQVTDAYCRVSATGTKTIGNCTVDGGTLECYRKVLTKCVVSGGIMLQKAGDGSNCNVSLEIAGGQYDLLTKDTVNSAIVSKGVLDMSQAPAGALVAVATILPGGNIITNTAGDVNSLLDLRKDYPPVGMTL